VRASERSEASRAAADCGRSLARAESGTGALRSENRRSSPSPQLPTTPVLTDPEAEAGRALCGRRSAAAAAAEPGRVVSCCSRCVRSPRHVDADGGLAGALIRGSRAGADCGRLGFVAGGRGTGTLAISRPASASGRRSSSPAIAGARCQEEDAEGRCASKRQGCGQDFAATAQRYLRYVKLPLAPSLKPQQRPRQERRRGRHCGN
jgi:hypothetical protein